MKKYASYVILAGAAVLGAALFLNRVAMPPGQPLVAQPVAQKKPAAKTETPQALDEAKKAVLANVRTFTEAFNRGDVTAILKLFTDDCELVEHDGTTIRGLKNLEEELRETFKIDPQARISTSIESLHMVTPDVLIEEGKTDFYPDGKTLTAETDYQATHVKKGDKWLMSRVRSFNRVMLSPYDLLRDLEWLVGDWVDEGTDSVVESSYAWDANKSFLLQNFTVRVKGQKVLTGTQRIGRDPLTKQIKGWVFDSEGGYAESLWSEVGDVWVIKSVGVRADGKVVTVTNQLTPLAKDRFRFESVDRIVGEERMPNLTVVAVRKPPQASVSSLRLFHKSPASGENPP